MVQKVDISALAKRRNRSFYLFEGLGINSHKGVVNTFTDPGKDSDQILIHREQQAGSDADSFSGVGRQTWVCIKTPLIPTAGEGFQ